jgi:hypothetical protein
MTLSMQPQTNEETLWISEQMKHNMQLQTNEAHSATENKLTTLWNCKQQKNIMQLQTNEKH